MAHGAISDHHHIVLVLVSANNQKVLALHRPAGQEWMCTRMYFNFPLNYMCHTIKAKIHIFPHPEEEFE
jgi:hypothetical protein